jgi:hypothetical protein
MKIYLGFHSPVAASTPLMCSTFETDSWLPVERCDEPLKFSLVLDRSLGHGGLKVGFPTALLFCQKIIILQ